MYISSDIMLICYRTQKQVEVTENHNAKVITLNSTVLILTTLSPPKTEASI